MNNLKKEEKFVCCKSQLESRASESRENKIDMDTYKVNNFNFYNLNDNNNNNKNNCDLASS